MANVSGRAALYRLKCVAFAFGLFLICPAPDAIAATACPEGNSANWDQCSGTLELPDGGRYVGDFKKGKPEGKGRFISKDASLYVGEIRNGSAEGQGVLTLSNGRSIEGTFKNGVPTGSGRISDRDQSVYLGEIENGIRSGFGKIVYIDGLLYTGSFRSDVKSGYGVLDFPNGDRYEGEFRDDEPTEKGELKYLNGEVYKGMFLYNRPNGMGTLKLNSQKLYVGQFQDGAPGGSGELRAPTGEVLEEGIYASIEQVRAADAKTKLKSVPNTHPVNAVIIGQQSANTPSVPVAPSDNTGNKLPIAPSEKPMNANADILQPDRNRMESHNFPPQSPLHVDTLDKIVKEEIAQPEQKAELPKITENVLVGRVVEGLLAEPVVNSDLLQTENKPEDLSAKANIPSPKDKNSENSIQNMNISQSGWTAPASAPLECVFKNDFFEAFISCRVTADHFVAKNIVYNDGKCPAGLEYLKRYDNLNAAEWWDVISKLKAYYHYGPFDFRGEYRRNDAIYFLIEDCETLSKFEIISDAGSSAWVR